MTRRFLLLLVLGLALLATPGLAQDLRDSITALVQACEREDAAGFLARVHPEFLSGDETGNAYRYADLPRALADDFAILEGIRFTAFVGPVRLERESAWVQVRWSRRALVEVGAAEWIVLDQRSVLRFARGPDGEWLLDRVDGDAPFALADRRGRIVAREGTLDGEAIEGPVVIDRSGVHREDGTRAR